MKFVNILFFFLEIFKFFDIILPKKKAYEWVLLVRKCLNRDLVKFSLNGVDGLPSINKKTVLM